MVKTKKVGLDKKDYKYFLKDALNNRVVVGGRCKVGCRFCSCLAQKATGIKNWINFINKDDINNVMPFIKSTQPIYFGEGDLFLSCEPFNHPNYIELLEYFSMFFPNTTKITTTIGTNINPSDYVKIKNCRLSLVVSVNTLDKNKRQELMTSKDKYYNLIDLLRNGKEFIHKLSLFYFDLDTLKSDLEKLNKIDPQYISDKKIMLRLIDYSKYHSIKIKELHLKSKKTWFKGIDYFDKTVQHPHYWLRSLTDFPESVRDLELSHFNLYSARRKFVNLIHNALDFFEDNLIDSRKIGFLLAESVYDYFLEEFPELKKNAIRVKNYTFAGSYIVAPLLAKSDFVNAILKHKKFEGYLTSRLGFRWGADILNNSVEKDYPFKLYLI